MLNQFLLKNQENQKLTMPFKSYKQQEYMFINHPEIAKRWAKTYGTLKKNKTSSKPKKKK